MNGVVTTSINEIVRTVLPELGLSIHSYLKAAQIGLRAVRDLSIGTLPTIKAVRLTVNEFREVSIPDDLVDWLRVGVEVRKRIVPLGDNQNYNRLPKFASDGVTQVSYSEATNHSIGTQITFNSYTFGDAHNDYGEITGRLFGLGDANRMDNFKFVPERGVIVVGSKLRENDTLYLEYVSYTKDQLFEGIPIIAAAYIEQYIRFNLARFDRSQRLGDTNREQIMLDQERRRLRARIVSVNKEDMLRVFRKNFKQSVKS